MPNVGFYVPDSLNARMQRLRDAGVEFKASAICQQALEAAVEREEKALGGDRLQRLVVRLTTTKTAAEKVAARAEAVGRHWAEEIAALSELRRAKKVLEAELAGADVHAIRITGGRVYLDLIVWTNEDDSEFAGTVGLPDSVPTEFFAAAEGPEEGVSYASSNVYGFLHGAVSVLEIAERALAEQDSLL